MLKRALGALVALAFVSSAAFAQAPANSPLALFNQRVKAAVSGQPIPSSTNPLTSLQNFTLADLNAAAADAAAQNPPDTRHGQCWTALATVVQAIQPGGILPSGLGVAQLAQKAFDLQSTFQGHQAWKDTLATACALTVADLATDLNTLIAKAGLSVANTALIIPKI